MDRVLDRLYRRLGKRYFLLWTLLEAGSAVFITLGSIGLLTLYEDLSSEEFWRLVIFTEVLITAVFIAGVVKIRAHAQPVYDWVCKGADAHGEDATIAAWRSAVTLPKAFVRRTDSESILFVCLPVAVFATLDLDLPWYSVPILFAAACVCTAYAAILHFFASEQFLRPLVRDIAAKLPRDFETGRIGIPLRWKLLGALPLINVVTGVVVSGLSTTGQASLQDLGLDVLVALVVAFTLVFELTVLVTRSVLNPVGDLLRVTDRVKQGDLSARAPVMSGDELGALASSFNEMLSGLEERESLREAFGYYVNPEVAERVVEEGALLEGEEVEVSIVFVDIRDFTAYADQASARETVAYLNRFFELVVPILTKHGGHANKFVGDGVLGVFGVPERLPNHANRAVAAACEIADAVEEAYGDELRIGIGVNSGPVVAGSVGGGDRLDFTVIGDPVNVTARVQEVSKKTGDVVLVTEAARCLLQRSDVELEERGAIPLRGKPEPVPIWAIARAERAIEEEAVAAEYGR
jgi:adenylate cyclase